MITVVITSHKQSFGKLNILKGSGAQIRQSLRLLAHYGRNLRDRHDV